MVEVKIYVEGGGDYRALRTQCRKGFREFFEKAGLVGRMPHIVACGGRTSTYEDFCIALANTEGNQVIILLVDSEDALAGKKPWDYLKSRKGDGWDKPARATDDNVHLMVQCMESWFLADRDTLVKFYGQAFNPHALPHNQQIEIIPKKDVLDGLENASRNTQKGMYAKGKISFQILGLIDPRKVADQAPYAKRLIEYLDKLPAA